MCYNENDVSLSVKIERIKSGTSYCGFERDIVAMNIVNK